MDTLLIIVLSAFVGFLLGVYYQKRQGLHKIREEFANMFLEYIEKNKEKIDSGEINPFEKLEN